MPYANTTTGQLHYNVVNITAPWHPRRETIIFHHGIGAAAGIWKKWLPWLADKYEIVVFDMRGYGNSHIPPADFHWSLERFERDVFAIADAVEAERFHLVGESIGGTIALKCALSEPARIKSITVSNGAHIGATIQRTDEWRERIDQHGIEAWSNQFMLDRFFEGALAADERSWFAQSQQAWPRDSILGALSVLVGTDLTPELCAIQCPALLMHGDSSPFIPAYVMTELHKLLPDSSLQIFAHARHGLPFSHAAECAKTLRGFLERIHKQN
ncbi:alpha/beta fold hydrolase [Paralcaligenes ginsengisoli]